MGLLIDGVWHDQGYETAKNKGQFIRAESNFRNWVTPDGAAGPSGEGGFAAEAGRYHLYVSFACPWAHRTLIMRSLKGLNDMIDLSVVHWHMKDSGWTFAADDDGLVGDKLSGKSKLYDVYLEADPTMTGRVTVPILWDKKADTIVSNESSEIIRMFNSAFDGVGARAVDFYPAAQRGEIDEINARIYETVNNGVYRAGFATSQEAYEAAVTALFDTLDVLEERLAGSRFLHGSTPQESDWRLFPTLLRFDSVYFGHFKCNLRRLVDYPNLWGYTRDLYQWPGIAETVNFKHNKLHYYTSHGTINPNGIVPLGPVIDWDAPHHRGAM